MRAHLQQFGAFLAGMVVPNVGAFIAWGLLTALFIPAGWLPNPHFAKLVDPVILNLLRAAHRLLRRPPGIRDSRRRGGRDRHQWAWLPAAVFPCSSGRWSWVPLGGWVIKTFDRAVQSRIPAGFEMLVANFSAGFWPGPSPAGYTVVGGAVTGVTTALSAGARAITNADSCR